MPYINMTMGLVGQVPGLPFPLAQTIVNDALGNIYDDQMWSFQLAESGWLTPGLLFSSGSVTTQSTGTITAVAYSNQVVGDANASALWAAYVAAGTLPLITSFQIRSPYYSLYNIIAYSVNGGGFGVFTLDRVWMEPPGVDLAYMVYQAYFAAPVADFKRFFSIRDTTNNAPIDYWSLGQKDLMDMDPQRTVFNQPAYAVPYEVDNRVGSATLGYMLYELWPHPLSVLPYTIAFLRRGNLLVNPTDTVPSPLTEELVMWRAREVAFIWKEGQKGDGMERGSGADWKFLSQAAASEYAKRWKRISNKDRDLVDMYFTRYVRGAVAGWNGVPFSNATGQLNVGGWNGG